MGLSKLLNRKGDVPMPAVKLGRESIDNKINMHMDTLVGNVKAERSRNGLSIEEVAIAFRKKKSTYINRMNDPRNFTIEEIFRLADKLHMTVPELLGLN